MHIKLTPHAEMKNHNIAFYYLHLSSFFLIRDQFFYLFIFATSWTTALKNQETKMLPKPLMQPQELHLKTNFDLSLLIQLML